MINKAFGKNLVVTGWNCDFSLSIGILVKISTGDLVATTDTAEVGDGFLDVEIHDKIAGTWVLERTGYFFATISTAVIYENRSVSIFAVALGTFLEVSIKYLVSSFISL